jgi:hypothetical protein
MKRVLLFFVCFLEIACSKFLKKNPDSAQAPPSTIDGYQLMLDNDRLTVRSTPGLAPLLSDDIVLSRAATPDPYWYLYTWNPGGYQPTGITNNSWNSPYQAINYANIAIKEMPRLPPGELANTAKYNVVYGSAFFYRGLHHFFLQETFGQPYRPETAAMANGIPLRLGIDPQEHVGRSTVAAMYDQIVADLLEAARRLPIAVQRDHINRPCRPAAFALLARVLLVKQDYRTAWRYADSCLLLNDTLLHYDTVNTGNPHPFDAVGNQELLFQCSGVDCPPLFMGGAIDRNLYASYDSNDLRRSLFFQPRFSGEAVSFRGYYSSGHLTFSGCAVDETYLIRAECKARTGDVSGALADLNKLLSTRWKPGTFRNYTAATADQALQLVLTERRKELVCRELRWTDRRRLNQDERFATTIRRSSGDSLLSGDARYTLLIPEIEIALSGIPQNPVK